jgi:hypothetical protein
MKTTLITLALIVFATTTAHAARRRAVARPVVDELAISFIAVDAEAQLSGGFLEVGAVTKQVRQTIGVRIDRRGSGTVRTAVVRAYIDGGDGACMVRIDGKAVGVVPVVVDQQAPFGAVAVHRITIDVPASAPAGALNCQIVWEATTP